MRNISLSQTNWPERTLHCSWRRLWSSGTHLNEPTKNKKKTAWQLSCTGLYTASSSALWTSVLQHSNLRSPKYSFGTLVWMSQALPPFLHYTKYTLLQRHIVNLSPLYSDPEFEYCGSLTYSHQGILHWSQIWQIQSPSCEQKYSKWPFTTDISSRCSGIWAYFWRGGEGGLLPNSSQISWSHRSYFLFGAEVFVRVEALVLNYSWRLGN